MAVYYPKGLAETEITDYCNTLDDAIYKIMKNLNQMDFDNVDARERANELAEQLVVDCLALQEELQSYTFE